MFNDYMLMHSTCDASLLPIAFNTVVAATIIALLWLPLAHAAERPSGIPDEAKYVKVDRVIDGDTIVLMIARNEKITHAAWSSADSQSADF